jgi:hypothetical protein
MSIIDTIIRGAGDAASFAGDNIAAGTLGRVVNSTVIPRTRVGFYFVSDKQMANSKGVYMAVNPQSVAFSQSKRFTKVDTMNGSTFTHFMDESLRDLDVLKLQFTGSTGNINLQSFNKPKPVSTWGAYNNPFANANFQSAAAYNSLAGNREPAPEKELHDKQNLNKLLQWQKLYALTREERTYKDEFGQYKINNFYVVYSSPRFPIRVTLTGFFDTVMSFTDSADAPFNGAYSFSFIATDSTYFNDANQMNNDTIAYANSPR